jgi:hypothetical protein
MKGQKREERGRDCYDVTNPMAADSSDALPFSSGDAIACREAFHDRREQSYYLGEGMGGGRFLGFIRFQLKLE